MKIELNKDTGKIGIRMKAIRKVLKNRFPKEDPDTLLYVLFSEPAKLGLINELEDEIAFVYLTEKIRFSISPEKHLTVILKDMSEMLRLPSRVQKILRIRIGLLLSP